MSQLGASVLKQNRVADLGVLIAGMLALVLSGIAVGAVGKATAQDERPLVFADAQRQLVLDEKTAIGSMDGEHDAFGRIMSLAVDSRGRLIVADDLSQDLKVFELTGEFVAAIGGSGEGPGEFHSPWQVQVGPGDSLYVWDPGHAAISVFGPDYQFKRRFLVPPGWTVNSMIVHPGPEIVVSVSGTGELLPIKTLSGDGDVTAQAGRSGPPTRGTLSCARTGESGSDGTDSATPCRSCRLPAGTC